MSIASASNGFSGNSFSTRTRGPLPGWQGSSLAADRRRASLESARSVSPACRRPSMAGLRGGAGWRNRRLSLEDDVQAPRDASLPTAARGAPVLHYGATPRSGRTPLTAAAVGVDFAAGGEFQEAAAAWAETAEANAAELASVEARLAARLDAMEARLAELAAVAEARAEARAEAAGRLMDDRLAALQAALDRLGTRREGRTQSFSPLCCSTTEVSEGVCCGRQWGLKVYLPKTWRGGEE